MKGADLSEPQRLIMADTVTKNSKTGITANKRLLVIKKGYLFYYSNVPKNFKNDIKFLETYQQLPKCSIEILNIKKINGFQENSNYFSIQFEAKHMMQQEDIRKTMTLEEFNFAPKNKKQTITWQFTCDNQQIKQKWVHTLQTLHAHYSKQKINIQKFFDNINKKDDESPKPAIRSSLMVPWRQDQIKKSSSNESLSKIRGSQISNLSPAQNSKKSANSNSDKNSPNSQNEANQIKLIPQKKQSAEQQDIVQSFMKIEKTKSLYEPVTTPIAEETEILEVPETPKETTPNVGFGRNDDQFIETPEINRVVQESPRVISSMTKKVQIQQIQPNPLPKQESIKVLPKQPSVTLPTKTDPKPQILIQQKQTSNKSSKQKFQNIFQPRPLADIPIPTPSSPKKISSLPQPPLFSKAHSQPSSYLSQSQQIQFNVEGDTNFYELIYFSSNRQYSFEKRIEAQKRINYMIGNFGDKAVKNFIQFVHEKAKNSHHQDQGRHVYSRYSEEKIGELISIVEIGLFKYKIGYVNTQAVVINGKQKIFYNQAMQKIYQKILQSIHSTLKSSSSQSSSSQLPKSSLQLSLSLSRSQASQSPSLSSSQAFNGTLSSRIPSRIVATLQKLRVPLCMYIEYKGISTLVYDNSKLKNKEQIVSEKERIGELKEVLALLGFNGDCFQFWRVETAVGEIIVVYVVNTSQIELKKQSKHHNLNFSSPLNIQFIHQAKKDNASTSVQSVLSYIKKIDSIKERQIFRTPYHSLAFFLNVNF